MRECISQCDEILHLDGVCNSTNCNNEGFVLDDVCKENCAYVNNISGVHTCVDQCQLYYENTDKIVISGNIDFKLCVTDCSIYEKIEVVAGVIERKCLTECPNFIVGTSGKECVSICLAPKYVYTNDKTNQKHCVNSCPADK